MSAEATLGGALALHRRQLGLDFTGAALAMGVSRSTYTAYEADARRLSPDTLRVLAKFLGVPVEDTLEMFGATCVLQARRALLGDDGPEPARETDYIARARANAQEEMEVLRRVYFDPDATTSEPERTDAVAESTSTVRASGPDVAEPPAPRVAPIAAASVGDDLGRTTDEKAQKSKKKKTKKKAEKNKKRDRAKKRKGAKGPVQKKRDVKLRGRSAKKSKKSKK